MLSFRPPRRPHRTTPARRGTGARGFTLVEVMMAATILVVGFIGIIQAVTIGSEMLDTARKQIIAEQIIDGEIENLRLGKWTTLAGLPANPSITVNQTGTAASDTPGHSGSLGKFQLDNNPVLMAVAPGFVLSFTKTLVRTGYYRITFTVTWTSNTGRSYSRSREAYFGQYGLNMSYQKA
jgi:prepilin-type N-terminal cleavage/methylation domain-containing protein